MQQNFFPGNQFQNEMHVKFNVDVTSKLAITSYVSGKEELVYGYIREIGTLFQPVRYGLDNASGLYSDHSSFKKHFVKYWRNALDISLEDSDKLGDIFDKEVDSQESCKKRIVASVFFEDGRALTAEDCLYAVYEVFKMYSNKQP